ncbi:MAG: hypothetical protein HDT36_04740, partial [Clostridiales bacterium]|nr:hypothetical protein [Clostridiales bacterium]
CVVTEKNIGGIEFVFPDSTEIVVWKAYDNDNDEEFVPFVPTEQGSVSTDGDFYFLHEAFEKGFLTKEELQNIAYYQNDYTKQFPEQLSDDVALIIKSAECELLRKTSPQATLDDITITKYYGTYNGCVVVVLDDPFSAVPTMVVNKWIEIGGVQFHYKSFDFIRVYK